MEVIQINPRMDITFRAVSVLSIPRVAVTPEVPPSREVLTPNHYDVILALEPHGRDDIGVRAAHNWSGMVTDAEMMVVKRGEGLMPQRA